METISQNKYMLPFKIKEEVAVDKAKSWLKDKDGATEEKIGKIRFEKIQQKYLPIYFCSGDYNVNWGASVGFYRNVLKPQKVTKYIYGNRYEKTEYVNVRELEYQFANGNCSNTFYIINNIGDKIISSEKDDNFAIYFTWESEDLQECKKDKEEFINVIITKEECENKANKKISDMIRNTIKYDLVSGDDVKNIKWDGNIRKNYEMILYYPIYIIEYKYDYKHSQKILFDGRKENNIIGTIPEFEIIVNSNVKLGFFNEGKLTISEEELQFEPDTHGDKNRVQYNSGEIRKMILNEKSLEVYGKDGNRREFKFMNEFFMTNLKENFEKLNKSLTRLEDSKKQEKMQFSEQVDVDKVLKQSEANQLFKFGTLYAYINRLTFIDNKNNLLKVIQIQEIADFKISFGNVIEINLKDGKSESFAIANKEQIPEWIKLINNLMDLL